ncbi:hypothetical protein MTO96_015192 [Rhipicephalus appendiculatus]
MLGFGEDGMQGLVALRRQDYITTKDALESLAQVEQHINAESERAKQCLDDSTVIPVVQVAQKELIESI